jgi:putative DNA primase/helicase
VFVLSSGERSLETHVSAAPRTEHKAGQAMRLIDVPVQGVYGLFDNLHGHANGKLFSEALLRACQKHYGHAAPMFLKTLIDKMPTLDLHAKLGAYYQKFGPDLSAQEGRVARTFACVSLAGELAIEWKVLPWDKGEALAAARNIFDRWRKAQPQSATSREHAQILKKVADLIEKHGSSRFSDINWKPSINLRGGEEKEPLIHNRAGYWEDKNNNRMFLFNSAGLREATDSFDFRRVLKALDDAGAFFETGTVNEKAKRRRTPDDQDPKLYHIDPAKLDN